MFLLLETQIYVQNLHTVVEISFPSFFLSFLKTLTRVHTTQKQVFQGRFTARKLNAFMDPNFMSVLLHIIQ